MKSELRTIQDETDLLHTVLDLVFRKLDETVQEPRSGVPGEPLVTRTGANEVTALFTVDGATREVRVRATYEVRDASGSVVDAVVFGNEYSTILLKVEDAA